MAYYQGVLPRAVPRQRSTTRAVPRAVPRQRSTPIVPRAVPRQRSTRVLQQRRRATWVRTGPDTSALPEYGLVLSALFDYRLSTTSLVYLRR